MVAHSAKLKQQRELRAKLRYAGAGRAEQSIVFFDGECGLCNRSVQLLSDLDSFRRLRYAPLQGSVARVFLPDSIRKMTLADGGGTMVCICHGRAWIRSQALAQIGFSLGGIWRFLALTLFFIPLPIRECGYRTLARNRQGLSRFIDRWLGPVQCRIITIQRK